MIKYRTHKKSLSTIQQINKVRNSYKPLSRKKETFCPGISVKKQSLLFETRKIQEPRDQIDLLFQIDSNQKFKEQFCSFSIVNNKLSTYWKDLSYLNTLQSKVRIQDLIQDKKISKMIDAYYKSKIKKTQEQPAYIIRVIQKNKKRNSSILDFKLNKDVQSIGAFKMTNVLKQQQKFHKR